MKSYAGFVPFLLFSYFGSKGIPVIIAMIKRINVEEQLFINRFVKAY